MGLMATLRELKDTSPEELNRIDPNRPIMVDGSLSELVTQALNIAYTKKSMTTGEPFYGTPNPTGLPAPGAGGIPNLNTPDAPRSGVIRPSLEGMQQMQQVAAEQLADAIADAYDAKERDATSHLAEKPLLIYALPSDGMISEEMNSDITTYRDSGAVAMDDFVFVYTDSVDTKASVDYRVVDVNQRVKDYEGRGARVYPDLQSFINDLPRLRTK